MEEEEEKKGSSMSTSGKERKKRKTSLNGTAIIGMGREKGFLLRETGGRGGESLMVPSTGAVQAERKKEEEFSYSQT